MLVFAVVAALTPAQNDTFWQLRVGGDIWTTGEWPRLDRYSHTAAGAPWGNHEWLSQVAMFLVWRAAGMPGLELGAVALILATIAITYRLMEGPRLTRFVIMAAGMSLSSCVWVLRPQLVTLLGVAVLLALLVRERYRFIPVLFLVWGVAFGGVILAAALLAALVRWWRTRAVEARAERDDLASSHDARRRLVTLAVVLTASGAATTLTPLGVGIFHFVLESGTRFSRHITEWAPPVPGDGLGTLFWLSAVGFFAALVARRRGLLALAWPDLVSVAVALALFPLAARSLRNMGPFLIVATVATSRVLGADFRFRLPARWRRAESRPPATASTSDSGRPLPVNAILAVLAVAGAVAVAVAWQRELPVLSWRPIDDRALAAVRACPGPLYNRYDEGGYLIWFAPEKPVFVDGRQDPYPLAFLADVVALENGGPHQVVFERWRIGCAFLPADAALAARLRGEGWRASFADARWTVLTRPEPRGR